MLWMVVDLPGLRIFGGAGSRTRVRMISTAASTIIAGLLFNPKGLRLAGFLLGCFADVSLGGHEHAAFRYSVEIMPNATARTLVARTPDT